MKATYRVLTATAFLLLPAVLISSCDDKNSNPVAPSDDPAITGIEAPSFTSVGFGSKWHDPHIKGPKVRTFTNDLINQELPGFCEAKAKRFGSEDGAELRAAIPSILNSTDIGGFEDICAAGVYPVDQKIRGKLLTDVKELDFSYAGGDEAGAPRMRIPIDCAVEVIGSAGQCTTDGTMEAYAYIDARTCNDGDGNVGVVNGEDKADCPVEYDDYYYDKWALFVTAHPDGRVARKNQEGGDALTSVVLSPIFPLLDDNTSELSPHYLIWKVDVR